MLNLKNNKFRKIGILGITLIFGSICFINTPAVSNASAQSVLGIAKGGTNANTVIGAQQNLGITNTVDAKSTNNQFPSSKAVYDYINFGSIDKITIGGGEGSVAQCLVSTNCLEKKNWKQGVIDTTQNWWTIQYQKENSKYFMTGPTGGLVTGCSNSLDCSDAANWSTPKSVPGIYGAYMPTVSYGNSKFIAVGSQTITGCDANLDCSDANNWAPQTKLSGIDDQMIGSAYGDGYFIVDGRKSKVTGCLASTDCSINSNWSTAEDIPGASTTEYRGIAFGEGKFVATGYRSFAQCLSANDCRLGSSWKTAYMDAYFGGWKIAYSGGQFVGVGGYSTTGYIWRCQASTDCSETSNWTNITVADNFFRYITVGGGNFIAGGQDGKIYQCSQNLNCGQAASWKTIDQSLGIDIYSITYGSNLN
ncbi:MAG: hypothetical protein LBT85_00910 [Bifidobacteriaceae bacterium]|jgi:hypothetical protein|nr:hypothetical protein [Bifidobacteriaceae bacterium]